MQAFIIIIDTQESAKPTHVIHRPMHGSLYDAHGNHLVTRSYDWNANIYTNISFSCTIAIVQNSGRRKLANLAN